MPQNGFFPLRMSNIAISLYFCTKGIFFGWSQRVSMHLGPLRMQLRAAISFLRSGNASKWGFFPKDVTSRDFFVLLHKRNFFGLSQRALMHLGPLRMQLRAAISFLGSGNASKWVFPPKDVTYRDFFVLLHKRNFFRMVPKGLNVSGTFVHAAESGN